MRLKNTLRVCLEAENEEPAYFTFEKPKLNAVLERQKKIETMGKSVEATREVFLSIVDHLIQVEGLENSDGSPVSAADIQGLEIPMDLMTAIIIGYNTAVGAEMDGAKKNSKTE